MEYKGRKKSFTNNLISIVHPSIQTQLFYTMKKKCKFLQNGVRLNFTCTIRLVNHWLDDSTPSIDKPETKRNMFIRINHNLWFLENVFYLIK